MCTVFILITWDSGFGKQHFGLIGLYATVQHYLITQLKVKHWCISCVLCACGLSVLCMWILAPGISMLLSGASQMHGKRPNFYYAVTKYASSSGTDLILTIPQCPQASFFSGTTTPQCILTIRHCDMCVTGTEDYCAECGTLKSQCQRQQIILWVILCQGLHADFKFAYFNFGMQAFCTPDRS